MGFRTYIGPHIAGLFDHEQLWATPGVVTETSSGGVQIDVTEDVGGAEFLDLVQAWRHCSEHLEPSKVFAVPTIDEARKRIRFTKRSERYVPPPKEVP